MCSGRVDTPSYTSDSLRVTYAKSPMTNHENGKKNENGTYPWSSVTQTLRYGQPSHDGDRKPYKVYHLPLVL